MRPDSMRLQLILFSACLLISCARDERTSRSDASAQAARPPAATARELESIVAKAVAVDYGYTTVDLGGSVVRGQADRYSVSAEAADVLEVQVSSGEDNAAFTVVGPDGEVVGGTEDSLSIREWRLATASAGTYSIYVAASRGNATYQITVRRARPAVVRSGGIFVQGDAVVRLGADGAPAELAHLARSDDFPGFGPTFAVSPDNRKVAYIGTTEEGFALYLGREDEEVSAAVEASGQPDYRSQPVWAPDSGSFAFAQDSRIWLYDLESRTARVVARPDMEYGEAVDPSFSEDGTRLYYYSGSRFEYSFRGDRRSVLTDGSDPRPEPEDTPKYPGENLRGFEGD